MYDWIIGLNWILNLQIIIKYFLKFWLIKEERQHSTMFFKKLRYKVSHCKIYLSLDVRKLISI